MATKIKPWMSGALELLQHAQGHFRAGSDFDKRMAFISFDNAIETSIMIYRGLSKALGGVGGKVEISSFSEQITFLENYVTGGLHQEMNFNRDVFLHLHEVRNQLYHNGNGVVPEVKKLRQIREAAIWVFHILYKVDPTDLMTAKGPLEEVEPNANPAQVQFLQQFNSFRTQIVRTVEAIGLREPTNTPTEPEYDWDLFINRGEQMDLKIRYLFDVPRSYDRKVQEAVLAWHGLTRRSDSASLNASDEYYGMLEEGIEGITNYLKDFLISRDLLPEVKNQVEGLLPDLKAIWLEISGGEVLLRIRRGPEAYPPSYAMIDRHRQRDLILSYPVTDPPEVFHELYENDPEMVVLTISPLRPASDSVDSVLDFYLGDGYKMSEVWDCISAKNE